MNCLGKEGGLNGTQSRLLFEFSDIKRNYEEGIVQMCRKIPQMVTLLHLIC